MNKIILAIRSMLVVAPVIITTAVMGIAGTAIGFLVHQMFPKIINHVIVEAGFCNHPNLWDTFVHLVVRLVTGIPNA